MFGLGLVRAYLSVARPHEILDQYVGSSVLSRNAAVVCDFGAIVAPAPRFGIGEGGPKLLEFPTRFAELVLSDAARAVASRHVQFTVVDFELDAIARQRIKQ